MSSISSFAISIGLVAFLVAFLSARYPPSESSPFDALDLTRRNRWIKWGLYTSFLLPLASILPIYRYFEVPDCSLTPAISLFSVGFLAPAIWVLACTLPSGRHRFEEFIRYSELNDRLNGWMHRLVLLGLAAAGIAGLVWDLPRALQWVGVLTSARG